MKLNLPFKRLLSLFVLLTCFCLASVAQTIKGKIFDSKTGEPLTGATIQLERDGNKQSASGRLDGSYSFQNLQNGTYKLTANFVGYQESKAVLVNITNTNPNAVQNIYLQDLNTQLNEVAVTGQGSKVSDRAARGLEKEATSVMNILSQNAIQLLPDVTVGNALQRISGVTIQRSNTGEGRYAIIRGMDQRYNNTLVNGIKIPSPDDKYRFVPMDIFPSELLERLEVIKSLTPSMEGDAIGGTMNLVMKSAPQQFVLNVNAAAGYSLLFSDRPFSAFNHSGINSKSPAEIYGNDYAATYKDFTTSNLKYHNLSAPVNSQFGLTIGDRFLDKKLGIILSASYQNFYRGSNSDYLVPNAQPALGNTPFFSDALSRQYSTQTTQFGINNKIDYVFDKRNKISLYNFYLHQNEYQTRFTADTVLAINSTSTQKEVDIENRSMLTRQSVYNGTLKGEHQLTDALHLNWTGVYSIAKKEVPDMASYTVEHDVTLNNSRQVIGVDSVLKSMSRRWMHNSDKDLAGYLDLIYNTNIANRDVEFSAGGLYRHKTRTNYDNNYDNFSPFPLGIKQPFTNIDNALFGFASADDGIGNFTTLSANDYTAYENVASEYLQLKFNLLDKLQVIGGVRVESTTDNYNTGLPVSYNQRSGNISYTDVLPSVNFKYALTDIQNLRLSYYKAISRPGFGDIVPILIPGEYFDQEGNPFIKHTRSNNYDFRYELFPGGSDQVLLGGFYKDIYDPIEYFVVRNGGPSAQFIQPQNVNKATNYGLEALVTKFFGSFGVSANYTYTHSRVTTSKLFYGKDGTQTIVDQTRPLQGQADNVGNVSLLFKDNKLGLNMQLAFVYTGERIAQVSPYYNLDYWNRGYGQLDFSFEKTILKKLSFYGKINNLTNTANKVFLKYPHDNIPQSLAIQDTKNETLVEKDLYKISFLGGLRYKF
ncbi:TonB-dependent receptor [Mucilaginibacter sp. BJC16-A38]|uniref:TonB-dependent receptor n=1 Tax=Mucilaginibacter phenanthrenivorans TaxID=1234842 RepID=UPI002157C443|nr:TonB-dependent receptor [Mucilaginibacter phenanthrenivorans]MCR8560272.1 TonB-dependent receptor [Mucilaginibacter phenanthrenivorans]